MTDPDRQFPEFLERVVSFPGNISYRLLDTIAEYRICHDGTPREARIVFVAKQLGSDSVTLSDESFIIKVKVQVPREGPTQKPEEGPSTTTAAEIEALEKFTKANNRSVPHLVHWKKETQGANGPLPGGFITYVVMNKLPGDTLYSLGFLGMSGDEREEISQAFLQILRSICELGIEPIDRGLRNVLWEPQTKKCSIIDFELWQTPTSDAANNSSALYKWGLGKQPPIDGWLTAWRLSQR